MASRRRFLQWVGVSGAGMLLGARGRASGDGQTVRVEVGTRVLARIPVDFTGLSYESVQLYDRDFFAAGNTQLVKLFRGLGPQGVLRLGGNLSDLSRWESEAGDFATTKQSAAIEKGKQYWEWKLTDRTVQGDRGGAIRPAAIRNLRGFLDACGWRALYGLNFGSGSMERAADEAACVARELGDRLIAFQLGNEDDFKGGNALFRSKPYDFAQYYVEYQEFLRAVRARVPAARFAGPDTANNLGWVRSFAEAQKGSADKAVLLTSHYYAMGPAKDPAMNAERLLGRSAGLEDQLVKVREAVAAGGVGFRMTEGNSCFGGGKPGVSDAFCSALWVVDYMLQTAAAGYLGVNLHGGGDGVYTPIESLDAQAAHERPLYAGMQMAEMFAGCELLECEVQGTTGGLQVYAGRRENLLRVALINKSAGSVPVKLKGNFAERCLLAGDELGSTTYRPLVTAGVGAGAAVTVPGYSALVLTQIGAVPEAHGK